MDLIGRREFLGVAAAAPAGWAATTGVTLGVQGYSFRDWTDSNTRPSGS